MDNPEPVLWTLVLVVAVDTSTPAVTAGVVRLGRSEHSTELCPRVLATRVTVNARAHAEVLTPQILACLEEANVQRSEIDAIVTGTGPGPYTGLRVGMATAAAFGDALGVPVYGVCSLDAMAAQVGPGQELLVVTDARRREVYWARYRDGHRIEGPAVHRPAHVQADPSHVIAGSRDHADLFSLPYVEVQSPAPAGLVAVAARDIVDRRVPDPLVPLYLRRPDATEPGAPRREPDPIPPPGFLTRGTA